MRDHADDPSGHDDRGAAPAAQGPRGLASCSQCQGVFPPSRMVAAEGRMLCGDCARKFGPLRDDAAGGPALPARPSYDARMVSASVATQRTGEADGTRHFGGRYHPRPLASHDERDAPAAPAPSAWEPAPSPYAAAVFAVPQATPPAPPEPAAPAAPPAGPARPAMSSRIIPSRTSVHIEPEAAPEAPEIDENDPEAAPRRRSNAPTIERLRSTSATELPSWARPVPQRAVPPAPPPAPESSLPPIDRGAGIQPPSLSRTVLPPWERPAADAGSQGTASPRRVSHGAASHGEFPPPVPAATEPPPLPPDARGAQHAATPPGRTSDTGAEPRRPSASGGSDRFAAYADLRRRIDGGEDTLETRRTAAETAARLSLHLEAVEHAKRCLELAPDDDRMRSLLENVRRAMGLDATGATIAPADAPRRNAEEARPFWHDLGSAMTYPLRGAGLPVLLVGGLLIGLGQVIASINLFAWTVSIMIWGYVSAYLFDVINSTGSGKTSPPEMPEAANLLESYVFPFFATLTCALVSFVPCAAVVYASVKGWLPPAVGIALGLVLFAAGFFVFPMTLTVRAMFQSLGEAADPRVVFGSIGRIFPDYVAMFIATCAIWIAYGIAAVAFYALCWVALARPDASAVLRADAAGIAAWVLHTVLSWPVFLYALMLQGHLLGRMYRQGFKRLAWFVPATDATRSARKMSAGLGFAAAGALVALAGAAWGASRAYETMASGSVAARGTVCPIGDGAHLTYFWENTDGMAGLTEYRFSRQADGTMRVVASTRIAGQPGAPTDEVVGIFDPDDGVFTDAVPSWGQGVHFDGKVGRHVSFYGPKRGSIGSTYVNDWTVRGAERWQTTWPAFKVHDDQSTTDYYYDSASGVLVGSSFRGVGFVVTEWLVDSAHVAGVSKGPPPNRDFSPAATQNVHGGGTDEFWIPADRR